MVPKNKSIEIRSIVIDIDATASHGGTLIPAHYDSNKCHEPGRSSEMPGQYYSPRLKHVNAIPVKKSLLSAAIAL